MSFEDDLSIGKHYEMEVLRKIQQRYPLAYCVDGYCKDWDIYVPELEIGIEVKSDQKSKYTGNIVIEFEYNHKPSALATTKAAYWVFFDGNVYGWFTPQIIKTCITDNGLDYYIFKGNGDEHYKKAYLINKEMLFSYALQIND